MAETFVPSSSTPAATQVNVRLEELRSKAENPTTSVDDLRKALNDGLEWLVGLQRGKDNEVWSHIKQKDLSEVYKLWKERVSKIEKEVASLNEQFYRRRHIVKKIKRALRNVIKLVEECPPEILVDKLLERVIKEIGVPSIAGSPTLQNALLEVQQALLRSDGVQCVALEGEDCAGKTIIMQHLNNFFYDNPDNEFDVVIFIKVAADEQTDEGLHILQKIAERMKVDIEGYEFEVAGRVRKVLKNKRYLLTLDGLRQLSTLHWIWDISYDMIGSKVVITNHDPLSWERIVVDSTVIKLKPLSPTEAWKVFRERTSSSKSTDAIGEPDLGKDLLRLMRTWDFLHLILSYPMRIGYEDFLEQWIYDASQIGLRRGLKHILYDESPLRHVQAVIPQDIATEIINGGRVSREKPLKQVPQPIIRLATDLALDQLNLTLTSDNTLHYSRRALEKIQSIWFSARNDAEKGTVEGYIRARFRDLEIIDLNLIDGQTQREQALLNLKTRLEQSTSAKSRAKDAYALVENNYKRRHLVLVVDGDGDKKLDPQKVSLPINRDSKNVVVFITAPSSAWQNDYFSINADLTIKTEDHLLPWELFCKIVGSELLHSSIDIQEIAVQIVEKCGGHLLAIILMAQSLKHVRDVQTWELALKKLRYRAREAIVNAFLFNIIWANVNSEAKKFRLLRCLMIFKFLDWKMTSDNELFDLWFSEQLIDTKEEAKSILQNFMECSLLLQFEDTLGRYNIQLPEDIKIILHALGEIMPENLSEGALESTISDLQVLNLSYTHMRNLYAVNALPQVKELNLEVCMVETLPEAIFKLQKIDILSLEHCSQLLELSPQIAKLENLRELRLAGCERLKALPIEICELQKLEILSLEHCSQLLELSPLIDKLENLRELRLAECERLEVLPLEICKLQKLKTLSLEHCSQLLDLSPLIDKLENLRELRLTGCKRLKTLPLEICKLQKLETLSLEHCSQLLELAPLIDKLENLRELRLAGCKRLKTLPLEICKLQKLETLSLEHCSQLLELSPLIDELENLRKLRLTGCDRLKALPLEICKLQKLKTLSLEHCLHLLELSPLIDKLENLRELRLARCERLKTLPLEICKLQKLETLSLEHCSQLLELSPLIDKLENLRELRLARCERLKALPLEICKLQKLETLSLEHCSQLVELSPLIDKLKNLRELRLTGCKRLEALPLEICKLQKLETLSLEHCSQLLELAPLIDKLKNLRELRLARCDRLEALPLEICKLQKLKTLSLKHCSQLLELSPLIDKLKNLRELRLAGCERLEALPLEICKLQKLETLSVEHCSQLLELSPLIDKLENLRELRLARCERLKALPLEICKLQKLETLSLEHCSQLLKLPPNIYKLKNLRQLNLSGCRRLETLSQEI